jgi:hypothetical protein
VHVSSLPYSEMTSVHRKKERNARALTLLDFFNLGWRTFWGSWSSRRMGFLVMASLPPWGIGSENCNQTGKQLQTTSSAFLEDDSKKSSGGWKGNCNQGIGAISKQTWMSIFARYVCDCRYQSKYSRHLFHGNCSSLLHSWLPLTLQAWNYTTQPIK